MECIILAGGLGTRLRSTIGEQPKCMAAVNGKPFLHYLFTFLQQQGCTRVILSLGYKQEVVLEWLPSAVWNFAIDSVIEEEPLGTGGGILLAMEKANTDDVLVLNGDTLMIADLQALFSFHKEQKAGVTLTLTLMHSFDRYGTVTVDDDNTIVAFTEKKYCEEGLINAGVYAINKMTFFAKRFPQKFSFEKEYLEKYVTEQSIKGFVVNGYFIDIGIPDDYKKAQRDFLKLF